MLRLGVLIMATEPKSMMRSWSRVEIEKLFLEVSLICFKIL